MNQNQLRLIQELINSSVFIDLPQGHQWSGTLTPSVKGGNRFLDFTDRFFVVSLIIRYP